MFAVNWEQYSNDKIVVVNWWDDNDNNMYESRADTTIWSTSKKPFKSPVDTPTSNFFGMFGNFLWGRAHYRLVTEAPYNIELLRLDG